MPLQSRGARKRYTRNVGVSTSEQLLDEFVSRWTRGEPLSVEELLVRAGPRSDELAELIDAFLERAPRREPAPAAIAFVRSLDEPSLLRARQARRLKLDDLAAGLVEKLGLPTAARAKVRRYYQELELGQLDPAGVAANVWDALIGLLGREARGLAALRPVAPAALPMFRSADFDADFDAGLAGGVFTMSLPAEAEPDEVARLFGVTQSG
jgi:hypothetical protein